MNTNYSTEQLAKNFEQFLPKNGQDKGPVFVAAILENNSGKSLLIVQFCTQSKTVIDPVEGEMTEQIVFAKRFLCNKEAGMAVTEGEPFPESVHIQERFMLADPSAVLPKENLKYQSKWSPFQSQQGSLAVLASPTGTKVLCHLSFLAKDGLVPLRQDEFPSYPEANYRWVSPPAGVGTQMERASRLATMATLAAVPTTVEAPDSF